MAGIYGLRLGAPAGGPPGAAAAGAPLAPLAAPAGAAPAPAARGVPYVFEAGDITNPYAMTWTAYSTKLKPFLDGTYQAAAPARAARAPAPAAPAAPAGAAPGAAPAPAAPAGAAPAGFRRQAREAADMAVGLLTGPGPRVFINRRAAIPDANGLAILEAIKAVLPAGNPYNAQRAATNAAARTYWNTHLDAGAVGSGGVAAPFVVADYKTAIVNAID